MKTMLTLCLFLAGCTYIEPHIYVGHGGMAVCHTDVDRPVKVGTNVSPSGNTLPLVP